MKIQVKFGGNANGDAIMCSIKIIGRVRYEDVRTWGSVEKCKWWRMVFHVEIAGRKRRWTTRVIVDTKIKERSGGSISS